jgi:hypothetical protein
VVAGQEEKVVDRIVGGQEPFLCPVVEPLVLAVLLSLTLAGAEAAQIFAGAVRQARGGF